MFSFISTSRQERRALYMQQYETQHHVIHISHQEFNERYPELYHQIKVDCKRSLFTCFQNDDMKSYLSSLEDAKFLRGVDINALEYTQDYSRKSQSIFEAYLLDVLATNPTFNYFQGFAQILSVMFFVFLKDEYLLPNNELYNQLPIPVDENFAIFDRNPSLALENYEKLVQISVCLGEKCFGPENSPGIETLYIYEFFAFEPTLRFLDAELYVAITQKLCITSEILESTLFSGAEFICHRLYSSLRFLDIAVLGDWHLQLFVAAAALVISIRARGYNLDEEEFYVKAFTSLQSADNEIESFADKTIRLALAGYFMSFVAEEYEEKRNWRYIYENFSFAQVYGKVREFRGFETIIGKIPRFFDEVRAQHEGIAEGFIDIDCDREHYVGIIEKSVAYQIQNNVERVKMQGLMSKSSSFVRKLKNITNHWIEIGLAREEEHNDKSSMIEDLDKENQPDVEENIVEDLLPEHSEIVEDNSTEQSGNEADQQSHSQPSVFEEVHLPK